jgi:hypothetical protein
MLKVHVVPIKFLNFYQFRFLKDCMMLKISINEALIKRVENKFMGIIAYKNGIKIEHLNIIENHFVFIYSVNEESILLKIYKDLTCEILIGGSGCDKYKSIGFMVKSGRPLNVE